MKRIAIALLTGAALAVGLLQGASAAEIAVKAAPPPPPPPPPIWTGWYIGVHGGAAWVSSPNLSVTDPTGTLAPIGLSGTSTLGGVGGIQVGYNWQFFPGWLAPSWVIGVEGDISWASLSNQTTTGPLARFNGVVIPQSSATMAIQEQWLSSVRGKLGFVGWWGNTLFYATGGVAWANAEYTGTTNLGPFAAALAAPLSNVSNETTKMGWVAGGGAEWQATTNILLRVEYLYYRINGNQTNSAAFVPAPGAPLAGAILPVSYSWNSYNVQVARVALSYKF
jgi:outer membrane immunogenic protein